MGHFRFPELLQILEQKRDISKLWLEMNLDGKKPALKSVKDTEREREREREREKCQYLMTRRKLVLRRKLSEQKMQKNKKIEEQNQNEVRRVNHFYLSFLL